MPLFSSLLLPTLVLSLLGKSVAFDNTRFDNLAVYWGQNSYGATHSDTANFQKNLSFYCADNSIDAFPLAFLDIFFGAGGEPSINLANICNDTDDPVFSGTDLPNCQFMASDIQTCQSKGKIVTISLGGATGANVFSSDSQAQQFADQIWNTFLGGTSSTRPFGSAVLDGVDLDIEGGGTAHYAAFINQLRSHFNGASKKFYVTGAPQCPYPDGNMQEVLNAASFDAVYVQFYNNFCGLQNFNNPADWDFGVWDNWARSVSPNPNVKVYIGAPASSTAAGGGYVDAQTLGSYAKQMRNSFPSFGGVMLWDASQAYNNGRFDAAIKSSLTAAGGTGFTYPSCSNVPAYTAGVQYAGGSEVAYQGYIWSAKYSASDAPSNNPSGDWSAVSVCSGGGGSPTVTTTHVTTTTTSGGSTHTSTTTITTPAPTNTPGACNGVAAWASSKAYTAGQEVTYNGHLWTAKWWSEADAPGGAAGDWTDDGACTSSAKRSSDGNSRKTFRFARG